ncbi:hypothetical protein TNCV_2055871 [Trichonephila clavipes]|nr:hypothetical protein TNCV_2055871 [Trichonephila clavipes]
MPRHPASQGSVARSNQDVEAMLRTWLIDNNTKNWALGQLETVNKSSSTPASTVKTSVVLLASEWKAAVSDSKACCVVCGMESTGAHLCDICKNQMHAICGNTVGEEGYG